MTQDEAIKKLMEACEDMAKVIDVLKHENEMLVDIICRLNMGEITKEEMMAEFDKIQKEADALCDEDDTKSVEDNLSLAERIERAKKGR